MNTFKNLNYSYSLADEPGACEDFYAHKYDSREGNTVDAIYCPTVSSYDKGNVFVEALPRMRMKERLELDANIGIDNFCHDTTTRLPVPDQISLLSDLKRIRVQLPSQIILEGLFGNMLAQVYRSRNYVLLDDNNPSATEMSSHCYAYGKPYEAPPVGFSLLGFAGCGKTSMIGTLLSHYPQVITHHLNGKSSPQVLYLMCNSNSSSNNDFNAVLNDIGRQLDIALGLHDGVYYDKLIKLSNYDKKITYIKKLITIFNIGCIIIDEIQNLDFSKNKKETYSKLLQLSNETNIAFILVGTEEAYDRMFSDLHMHRRFPPIIASNYTGDIRFTYRILRTLFRYQWFEKEISVPAPGEVDPYFEEIVKAFHECTNGIASLLVELYDRLNFEYIRRKKKPDIDGDYIKKVFKRYFGKLDEVLNNLNSSFSHKSLNHHLRLSRERRDELIAQLQTKDELERLTDGSHQIESNQKAVLMKSITRSILMCMGEAYTETQIKNACKSVLSKKDALEKSEPVLTRETLDLLNSKPKNPKKKAPSHSSITAMLKEPRDETSN